jgi:hypothetical protein
VGSAAPHRFFLLSFAGIANQLALKAPEDYTVVEKRRRRFALPAQSKVRLLRRTPDLEFATDCRRDHLWTGTGGSELSH